MLVGILASAIRSSNSLLFATLGGAFEQRSGVLNLGIEGNMALGAFAGFAGAYFFGNPWIGVLAGMVAGGLGGLLIAFLTVKLRLNQSITGVIWATVGFALSAYLVRIFIGKLPSIGLGFGNVKIPLLSEIPILGPILFRQTILTYIGLLLVPIFAFILFRTDFGLKIRAVGENPRVADSLGVDVYRTRYLCTIVGGMLEGLGGAHLTIAYLGMIREEMILGRGWIAVALVIFGAWKPFRILLGTFFFGLIEAMQWRLQALQIVLPHQVILMFPYILTIIALIFLSGKKGGPPASLGRPYSRGER